MGRDGDLIVKWIRKGGVCGLLGGGVTVLVMRTAQQAIFGPMKRTIAEAGDPAAADTHRT